MHATDRGLLFVGQITALRAFVRIFVRDRDSVDELIQELAVTVLEHPRGPADAESFQPWCRGVARHLTMHHRRSFARLTACKDSLEAIRPGGASADVERELIARDQLARALGALDENARRLLLETFVHGMTSAEMARQWKVSPAAIRMLIMRLRRTARSTVDPAVSSSPPRRR